MSHAEGASSRTKSHEINKITKANTPNDRCKEPANEPKGPSTEASEEGELLKRPGVLSKAVAEAKVPRFRSPPASHLPSPTPSHPPTSPYHPAPYQHPTTLPPSRPPTSIPPIIPSATSPSPHHLPKPPASFFSNLPARKLCCAPGKLRGAGRHRGQ